VGQGLWANSARSRQKPRTVPPWEAWIQPSYGGGGGGSRGGGGGGHRGCEEEEEGGGKRNVDREKKMKSRSNILTSLKTTVIDFGDHCWLVGNLAVGVGTRKRLRTRSPT